MMRADQRTDSRVVVVDFGAGSGKVFDAVFDGRRVTVRERHRFANRPLAMAGHLYNNIGYLYDQAKQGILHVASLDGGKVLSVGVDSWGNDYGLLNRRGELIGMPYNYRDAGTFGFERLLDRAVFPDSRALYEITGIPFIRTTTYAQLLVRAAAMEECEREAVAAFMMTPDLVSYFLTGVVSCEYVETSTSCLVDARRRDWSETVLATLPFRREAFPAMVAPGSYAGPLTDPDLRLPRLRDTLLCKSATHDTGSAVVSVPCPDEAFIYISCGSWSLMGIESSEPVIDDDTHRWEFHNQGIPEGRLRVQKSIPGLWLVQQCLAEWRLTDPDLSFGSLEARAAAAKPFASYINIYEPQFTLPGGMPDKVREFCAVTGQIVPVTPGEIVRCIYESLALKYMTTAAELDAIGRRRHETIYLVGGGAKDGLLASMVAGATGKRVVLGAREATALGNALVQFIAAGRIADVREARRVAMESVDCPSFLPAGRSEWEAALARSPALDEAFADAARSGKTRGAINAK